MLKEIDCERGRGEYLRSEMVTEGDDENER